MATKRFRLRWRAISLMAALLMLTLGTLSGARAQAAVSCSVSYTIVNQWDVGFQAEVVIRNTGSAAINGWTLSWAFPNGQTIYQLWNATYTQSGANVSARNLSWNATISPGGSQNLGFLANWSGTNNKPTAFTLNGGACSVAP